MSNLIEQNGGQPQKQPKYVPIFMDRAFTGLYTQRAVLHDPSDVYTARYYGGRPDALLGGRNVELTNRLTLQRRPGMVPFRTSPGEGAPYATAPDRAFSFQLADGTIRVIIDTQDSGLLAITAAANTSGGNTVYTGTFPGGASDGYAGMIFTVDGFVTNAEDNGTFTCIASTTTTLTLNNAVAVAETIAATAETAGAVYWDKQDGTATLIYAKTAGAGQMYFISVAGVLYMGDGQDTKKYTPLNVNGTIWNWGIVAPTVQPGVTSIASGSAATTWQKNTNYTTMGLTKDTNATPQIWQLIGTNDDGTNPGSQYGTAGTGEPNWASASALWATIVDNGVTWINAGRLDDWMPNTFYTDMGTNPTNHGAPGAIGVASVTAIYANFKNSGNLGKTETPPHEPLFSGAHPGASYFESNSSGFNGLNWFPLFNWSAGTTPLRWKQSHTYQGWYAGSPTGAQNQISGASTQCCVTGSLPSTLATPVYLFIPLIGGTSGSGYAPFPASAGFGQIAHDGQLTWQCLGQAAWQANHGYTPWTAPGATFSVIYDGANFQVAQTVTGNSGATAPGTGGNPAWATTYGSTTPDSGVIWTCVGPNVAWVAGSSTTGIWHLPVNGFSPSSPSQKFGGSQVEPTNGNTFVQAVISSGKSGSGSEPTWLNPTTTDNTITWQQAGAILAHSLPNITYGLCYAYSFKGRPVDDFYSPLPLGGGATPPGSVFLGAPFGSETNAISSASPPNQLLGAATGTVNVITGRYSPDPQVDTIVIWRSADSASGQDNMFELTEIPNIPALANTGPTYDWSFQDYLPSVASGSFPGLNVLLPAPINGVNDPPLSTYLPQVYNYQRIWGSNGQSVNFSGGPDTNVGNPNEAFLISDELPFLAPVVRLIRTPQGIVTFLTDSIEMISGGPATATFFSTSMAPGIGLLSYNACDVFAGEIYFFAADNTFRVITPALNMSQFGFPLGDQFANTPSFGSSDTTWDPTKVYVAIHNSGIDNCIFVADGSTGWYRLNPHQVPGAAQGPEPVWSPFAVITGGMKMVQSVETAPGIKKLLAGGTAAGDNILERSLTTFSDDGVSYDAFFTMGSINLAKPGQLALLKFLEFDFSGANYQPQISYLLNEISGTFTDFVNGANGVPQFDPPSLYGETLAPTSYSPNRYYFNSNADVARCRHMQINVDFGGGSETFTTSIITAVITSNVLTLTVTSTVGFQIGQTITLSGLTNATFLNGQTITLTNVTPSTLVGNFTHADYINETIIDSQTLITGAASNNNGWSGPTITAPANTWAFWVNAVGPASHNATAGNPIPSGWTMLAVAPDYEGSWEAGQVVAGTSFTPSIGSVFGFVSFPFQYSGSVLLFNTNGSTPAVLQQLGGGGAWSSITTGNFSNNVSAGSILLAVATSQTAGPGTGLTFTDSVGNNYVSVLDQTVGNARHSVGVCVNPTPGTKPALTATVTGGLYGTSASIWFFEMSNIIEAIIPDTGSASVTLNTGSVNGDEMYSLTIYGRTVVES